MFGLREQVRRVQRDTVRQTALLLLAGIGGVWLSAAAVFALQDLLKSWPAAMALIGTLLVVPFAIARTNHYLERARRRAEPEPAPEAMQPVAARLTGLAERFGKVSPLLATAAAVAAGILIIRAPRTAATLAQTLADAVDLWERSQSDNGRNGARS